MTAPAQLQKLVTWLSPAFPVGAFAWSAGLETAIADRIVTDSMSVQNWIEGAVLNGGLRTDAMILAAAHAAVNDAGRLAEIATLCLALTPSAERWRETTITADSFRKAVAAWPVDNAPDLPLPCPYPVAVGAVAAAHGIGRRDTLLAFVTAAVHGQVSVAVRLVPLGQSDGLKVMASVEAQVARLAEAAETASLAEIGGMAYAADIAQMRHETLEPRIFRS